MQANRLIASELNALNSQMHSLAESMTPDDWTRRNVPGTNLPAFSFWHIARVIDSTVNLALRGAPQVIASEPFASKAWARPGIGTGFSRQEADELAAQVVPEEALAYADAVRAQVNQWLRGLAEEELDAPARLLDRVRTAPGYANAEILETISEFDGQPVWLVLSLACFAHGWAHLEEIRLLVGVERAAAAG